MRRVAEPCQVAAYLVGTAHHHAHQRVLEQQQHQEQEPRESEERFRVMADGLALLIWVHDATRKTRRLTRTSLRSVHASAVPSWVRYGRGGLMDKWRWLQCWAQPRLSDSGEFLGLVGASADITERKQAESELARQALELADLNQTLDRRVKDRTIELQELNRELAQTEHRERTQLAQVLHDGLQQFLVAARMHADLVGATEDRESRDLQCRRLQKLLIPVRTRAGLERD